MDSYKLLGGFFTLGVAQNVLFLYSGKNTKYATFCNIFGSEGILIYLSLFIHTWKSSYSLEPGNWKEFSRHDAHDQSQRVYGRKTAKRPFFNVHTMFMMTSTKVLVSRQILCLCLRQHDGSLQWAAGRPASAVTLRPSSPPDRHQSAPLGLRCGGVCVSAGDAVWPQTAATAAKLWEHKPRFIPDY